MRVIAESVAEPRGPWKVQRVCSVQGYGGCGAVLEITIEDLTFPPHGITWCHRRGSYVCPCCGKEMSTYVPEWATRHLREEGREAKLRSDVQSLIEAGRAFRELCEHVRTRSSDDVLVTRMADAGRKWDEAHAAITRKPS